MSAGDDDDANILPECRDGLQVLIWDPEVGRVENDANLMRVNRVWGRYRCAHIA
jgi:hypothetical protein